MNKLRFIICLLGFSAAASTLSAKSEFEDLLASGDLSQFYTGDKEGKWTFVDGAAYRGKVKAGNLMTRKKYKDFELHFEWKIAEGGNSGVIYRVNKWPGVEYQVLDDERHVRGKTPNSSAGALYDLIAPIEDKPYNPAGQWNSSRIIAKGNHIEHWLNGVKIVEIEIGSADWDERFSKSKYNRYRDFKGYALGESHIHFQDHGAEVWYRNIKIRELKD
ncbi:DUF1080 domain-containing protein [Rubellicoccus peritrichatus]|uniref:DUF1080 domain-containing protein n=1 Tax=Rubellicoccus peritrichatus TaxID=3080537 RepID=A0AAQ3L7P4_9BACT|nr:DUF1080 domain-containing protein [Puniceicoccus sp. CR14]WOO39397.1 DUF1080 domain-containing protein [Puniceicoccus sp. CR14]